MRELNGALLIAAAGGLVCFACFTKFKKVPTRGGSQNDTPSSGAGGEGGVSQSGAGGSGWPTSGGGGQGGTTGAGGANDSRSTGGTAGAPLAGAGGVGQPVPVGGAGGVPLCSVGEERCSQRSVSKCEDGAGWKVTETCDFTCGERDGHAQCTTILRVCPDAERRDCKAPTLAQDGDSGGLALAFQAVPDGKSEAHVWRYAHGNRTTTLGLLGTSPQIDSTGSFITFVEQDAAYVTQTSDWSTTRIGAGDLQESKYHPPAIARTGRVVLSVDPPDNPSRVLWADSDDSWSRTTRILGLPEGAVSTVALSPDGNWSAIVFQETTAKAQDLYVYRLDEWTEAKRVDMDAEGSAESSDNPAVVANEQRALVAFDYAGEAVYLTRYDMASSTPAPPVKLSVRSGDTPPGQWRNPALSEGGDVLAFESNTDGRRRIFVCRLNDTPIGAARDCQNVSLRWDGAEAPEGDSRSPSLSPDGAYVAFQSNAALSPDATEDTTPQSIYVVKVPDLAGAAP